MRPPVSMQGGAVGPVPGGAVGPVPGGAVGPVPGGDVKPVAGRVVVVGLGPGDPGLLTEATRAAIDAIAVRFVRTARHPSSSVVGEATALDEVYEAATDMDAVYPAIVDRVIAGALQHGEVLYAVPGSPLVAERTVELLRADARVRVEVLPAMSFLDLAWARLGVDPVAAGVRLVDGHRFAVEAAGSAGPLLVAQCDRPLVLSDIKLSVDDDPGPVVVLQRLGLPDESVTEVAWADLDRTVAPDHLTCVWIPRLAEPVAAETVRLVELVRTLRERCPWDRQQTHRSLGRHLLEESYEVLDAIEELPPGAPGPATGDAGTDGVATDPDEAWAHLEEELGDLLFQVAFHATLGAEAGRFAFADVARGVHDKLVERHPHVFGGETYDDAAGLAAGWEQRKKVEKGRASVLDGIPATLPSVLYADKLQRKAATLGLDWPDATAVWTAVDGELDELRVAVADAARPVTSRTGADPDLDPGPGGPGPVGPGAGGPVSVEVDPAVVAELGDVLFSVVNLGRKLGVDAEAALRAATARFGRRVRVVESIAVAEDIRTVGASQAVLDDLWARAKGATATSR